MKCKDYKLKPVLIFIYTEITSFSISTENNFESFLVK